MVTKRGRKLFNPVEDTSDGRAMLRSMGVTGEKRDRDTAETPQRHAETRRGMQTHDTQTPPISITDH